mgnify:CR=1 FL=1
MDNINKQATPTMIDFCQSLDGVVVDDKVLKKLYISEANKQRDLIIDMASK